MCQVDQTIDWSLDQFGFSQVLVVLDDSAASGSPQALARSITDTGHRTSFYLKELPTRVGATAAEIRGRIAQAFDPDSPHGGAALSAAKSALRGVKGARSRAEGPAHAVRAPGRKSFPRLGVEWGYVDRGGLSQLRRQPQVKAIFTPASLSSIDPVEVRVPRPSKDKWTWGLRKLGVPALRAQGLTGSGVRVGHLDTGIDIRHPAFKKRRITFQEFDQEGEPVGTKPRDSGRHGTHTAGTICGGTVSGMTIGAAPDVELFAAMVIEGGYPARVLAGIEWCLEKEVHIMNMSLGYAGYTGFFRIVLQRVVQLGVLPVVAIGNDGVGTSCSPGNYEEVLSVGASNRKDHVAPLSSIVFNRATEPFEPNVVAPGVDVVSARAGGSVLSMDGTSMAAPHVTGSAALMLQAKPGTPPNTLMMALQITCNPMATFLKSNPASRRGYGLINPKEALKQL